MLMANLKKGEQKMSVHFYVNTFYVYNVPGLSLGQP